MTVRTKFFAVAIAVLAMASTASAATITYTLDKSNPGEFSLYATTSAGDNGGLVLYSVPLLGNVATLDNRTVNGISLSNFGPVGFTDIRSADGGGVNPVVGGSQNIVTAPAANRLYGIGQSAGSLAGLGITLAGAPDNTSDQAWAAKYLLARGTYTGELHFNTASPDLVGNAWDQQGGSAAPAAIILTEEINIPEPATFSLIGLALLGGLGFLRRR